MKKKEYIKSIDVYTDGSLKKTRNGNICGYGIYFPNNELDDVSKPFTNGEITNNRAELYAIYQSIIRINKVYNFKEINIYTDSQYAKKSLTEWIVNWKKNDWKNYRNKPVKNTDIIKKIDKYIQKYPNKINIIWIPAHTKKNECHSINNDMADKLANNGADMYKNKYIS